MDRPALLTFLTAVGGAVWAIWTWRSQRRAEQLEEHKRLAALYLMPFLLACEDLQSRLYNMLCLGGLGPLRAREGLPHAEETLYLVARYFAYEPLLLRHTQHGTDATAISLLGQVRESFASDAGGLDGWCLFRARQHALGQLALQTRQRGDLAVPDVISLLEFERLPHQESVADDLGIADGLEILRQAEHASDLPDRTRQRFAEVQRSLVDVLEYFESELARLRGADEFSLFPGDRRKPATT